MNIYLIKHIGGKKFKGKKRECMTNKKSFLIY